MKVATLGPAGTFSEIAARLAMQNLAAQELIFYPSLQRTLAAVPDHADIAVVPIENIVEGVVSPVVDGLVKNPLQIIAEYEIPVRFSWAANHSQPQKVFAQFVAQGQCSEWLSEQQLPLISTASNTEAFELLQQTSEPAAALVPEHLLAGHEFAWVQHDVCDVPHNVTRFVVLSQNEQWVEYNPETSYKSSILILDDEDHPGLLLEHLQAFAVHQINLVSLISRPTGNKFGRYHFFIEFEGHLKNPRVQAALSAIMLRNRVIKLGSYKI